MDFDCPFGHPWGAKVEPESLPPARPAPPVPEAPALGREAQTELSTRRYAICITCEQSADNGHACALYTGCCFGRWRTNPANKCPLGKWPTVETPAINEE